MDDVDLFVFHQANRFMLEDLRKKLQIPAEKFLYRAGGLREHRLFHRFPSPCTAHSREGRIRSGSRLMLVGFGVGY